MIRASGALTVSQARDYFDREYTRGDYYTGRKRAVPSRWSGRGARLLHLRGTVDRRAFDAVLEGKAGPGGKQLVPAAAGTGKHRGGWDFTCSPDKTVSIQALVGSDAGITEDVQAANQVAMAELERFSLGKDRNRHLETTGNLVIASFQHETSRRLDPQLHIHNVVMNLTRRGDGKFVGLEPREMFAAQAFAKSVFHADLALRLKARGYAVTTGPGGVVRLRDMPEPLVQAFSQRRRKDIEPYLRAHGQSGARAAEIAALSTRKGKERGIDPIRLRAFWRDTARGLGVDLPAIRKEAARAIRIGPGPQDAQERARAASAALAFAKEHLDERKAVFPARDLLATALRQGLGQVALEDLRQTMRADDDLVQVREGGSLGSRCTTRSALRLELRNIALMRQGLGCGPTVLAGKFEPSRPLSDGQRQVAEHILRSRDQVLAVEGKAGAGKTFTLQAVVEAARGKEWTVRGFAPDTSAVKTLAEETGVPARTLAALAQAPVEKGQRPQLWLVDEAGKMSSRQAASLLEKAREADAKVVLVGDRLQHGAVEAGMPFAYLQEAGLRAQRLDDIRRQREPGLLAAVKMAAEGRTREAAAQLAALGKVQEEPDRRLRHQAVVREFLATPRAQTCLVIAPSNEERKDLNRRIREALVEAGQVEKASYLATVRVSRGLTRAEKKELTSYRVGDGLTFQRGSRVFGIPQGATGRVTALDPDRRQVRVQLETGGEVAFAPARFRGVEVSRLESRRFAVGDRIQYREAQKLDGSRLPGLRIANGDLGIIRALDRETGQARIELEGSRRCTHLDLGRIQPVDHAYAVTSHASQGRTVDRALVVVDTCHSRELVNRQQFYVSISRAREDTRIYTSDRGDLGAAVSRDAGKESALALTRIRRKPEEREVSHRPRLAPGPGEGVQAREHPPTGRVGGHARPKGGFRLDRQPQRLVDREAPGSRLRPPEGLVVSAILLAREAKATRIQVPRSMARLEPEVQRLSARIRACGLEDPFRGDALKAIPPATLRGLLAQARGHGLLEEGPGWAQRGERMPALAETLRQTFDRQLALEGGLPLGPGRRS